MTNPRETGETVFNIFGQANGLALYPTNADMQRFKALRARLPIMLQAYTARFVLYMDDDMRAGFLDTLEILSRQTHKG